MNSGISNMILLTNARAILPQTRTQPATRFGGEQLVITFPKGWQWTELSGKVTISSPAGDAQADAKAYKGFKTLAAFENYVFSSAPHHYRQIGAALVYAPYYQVGIDRRFEVNKLSIMIREFQDANKLHYLGVGCVRLLDISVSVLFTTRWDTLTENRKVFEKSLPTVRLISKNLL